MYIFTIVDGMTTWSQTPGIEVAAENQGTLPPCGGPETTAVRSWQAAEGRLYQLITVDAVLYEDAVTLVREAAGVLRSRCADVIDLMDVDPLDILAGCPSAPVWTQCGLDPATAFDAARAFRWRELTPDCRIGRNGSNPGGLR